MKKKVSCELCSLPATTYCESDQASLCWHCDTKVHKANFLVTKHSRNLLCHLCQNPTPWSASGPMLPPSLSLCVSCANTSISIAAHQQPSTGLDARQNNDTSDDCDTYDDDHDNDEDDDDDDDDSENFDEDEDDDDDEDDNQVVPLTTTTTTTTTTASNSGGESDDNDLNDDDDDDGMSSFLPLKRKREFYLVS